MGRVVASVTVASFEQPEKSIRLDALVDTGASHLILPAAWRDRLGELELLDTVTCSFADQSSGKAEIRGPVKIQIEGFRPIYSEVMFIAMQPVKDSDEPLLGYVPLELSQAAVDMLGHRLLKVDHVDMKGFRLA